MPAPANPEELIAFVLKSGVVEEPRLRACLARMAEQPGGMPTQPAALAEVLVQEGLITAFHAEHFLQGKWKRFSLGKYKILEKIGTGGMGTVFLCEHKLMKRRVAVKVLPVAKAKDQSSLQRFYREARAVAALDHPNLVRAYDIDEDDGLHYLVMEYVDGTNLHELVKRSGPLDPIRACHYIYGAALGLHHANEMGLVHRDIKPANILVDRSGTVKILDMGLARFFNPQQDDMLTKKFDENVLGTADYLAPEQAIDSSTVDIRADIYGLGGTFHYLLIGQPPFPEGTVAQKLLSHQNKPPRAVAELRPDVPRPLSDMIFKMLAKDPADRFPSPADLIAALAPWVQTPIAPPAEHELPRLSLASQGGPSASHRSAMGSATALGSVQPSATGPSSASGSARSATPGPSSTRSGLPRGGGPAASSSPPALKPIVPAAYPNPTDNNADVQTWDPHASPDTLAIGQADTQSTKKSKSVSTTRSKSRSRSGRGTARKQGSWVLPVLVVGGVFVALALLGAGGALVYYKPWATKVEPTVPTGTDRQPQRWIVSANGTDKQHKKTLAEAVAAAGPGDTIAIADERLESGPIRITGAGKKGLRIEPATPGQIVTLVFKPELTSRQASLLELASVEDVVVKNLQFEMENQVDYGLALTGFLPGVQIEGLTILNPKVSGVRLQVVAGEASRPVKLTQLRVAAKPSLEAGLWIWTNNPRAANVHIRINGARLEGPAKAGIRIDGPVNEVQVSHLRTGQVESGIVVGGIITGDVDFHLSVERSTFYQIRGAALDLKAGIGGAKQELVLTKNYFGRTGELVNNTITGSGVKFSGNVRDDSSKEGNSLIDAKMIAEVAPENPDPKSAGAAWLVIPAESPLSGVGAE